MRAGSVRSLNLGDKEKYGVDADDANSAFLIPIPTNGNPTDTLANRFQCMCSLSAILRFGICWLIMYCSLAQDLEGSHRLL